MTYFVQESEAMNQSLWVALSFVMVALLVLVIWSIRRHRDPILHVESESPIDALIPSLAGLTLCTAVAGNSVEVLENGAFYDVLVERILAAEKSVNFETFLWEEGALAQRVANALSDREHRGPPVWVMVS
jgi:cardiolipin synthase A/B